MSKQLSVFLSDVHQADLLLDAHGAMSLRYLPTATRALSLSLPIRQETYKNKEVAPFVLGLLPDNEWTLKAWARQYGTSTHPFHLLSSVGHDCAGAVQFLKDAGTFLEKDALRMLDGQQVERELAASRSVFSGNATAVYNGRFSLAGAQPKIAVFQQDHVIARPLGRWPSTHIYKPTSSLEGQAENELFCLALSARLGLPSAQTDVLHFGKETALVSRRYDRVCLDRSSPLERKSWVRVHQEDLCQALGVLPAHKYQNQGGPTPAQIGQLLDRVSSDPVEDKKRFADALFFNWLVAGTDGHAKNFSLLHLPSGAFRLAPLYDIVSARPYPHIYSPKIPLSMKVGSTYKRNEIRDSSWVSLWKSLGLDPAVQMLRTRDLLDRFPLAVEETRADLRSKGVVHEVIDRMASAFLSDLSLFRKRLFGQDVPDTYISPDPDPTQGVRQYRHKR